MIDDSINNTSISTENKEKTTLEKCDDCCPECNSHYIILDSHTGNLVCGSCGIVIDEVVYDFSHGARAFNKDEVEKRIHNGAPISPLSDISWTTIINSTGVSDKFKRAVKWQSRLEWQKKNLLMAFTEIKRVCTNLGIPRVTAEMTAMFYRKILKLNKLRGRSINGFVGACIYAACRRFYVPRTISEIAEQFVCISERDILICFRVLISELKIKLPRMVLVQLVPKYASNLGISMDTRRVAENVIKNMDGKISTAGKDPKGFIAAALYLACRIKGENRSQKQIATACAITEVTLRTRIRDFIKLGLDKEI
ncbi:MAG: transcription initiation factor IIB [Promethearchaeota archaeon]